jgi:8-oxo-dGTP pyrophosphatase MutT (NUDIX family)
MTQKYKVYINDKVIIFRKSKITLLETENQKVYVEPSPLKLKAIISDFEKNKKAKKLYIVTSDPKTTFTLFALEYTIVFAAGGLVRNEKGELLLIFRNGRWDLPKGKSKKGEKPRQTAIREVMEETGISDLSIIKKLPSTYHTYSEKNKTILKKTYWFEMFSNNAGPFIPQTEEGITEVKWVATAEIEVPLNNTFLSVFNLISKYRKAIHF